jgi:3-phenylpropionate/trans-cinnamate dioxygenase beta subunit
MTSTAPARKAVVDAATAFEIQDFLYLEAELLDERCYAEWVNLVDDDFTYQVPTPRTPDSPYKPHWDDRSLLIDESKWSLMSQWFRRFDADIYETAWGENPPVRFRHVLSNVRVHRLIAPAAYEVRSNVVLIGTRQSDAPRYLSGRRTDQLIRGDNGFLLTRRRVVLDQVLLDFPQLRIML